MAEKLDNINIDKVPEEPLGKPIPFLSSYYKCPRCGDSVHGIFGKRDSKNVSWALNECEGCGYIYKVRTR